MRTTLPKHILSLGTGAPAADSDSQMTTAWDSQGQVWKLSTPCGIRSQGHLPRIPAPGSPFLRASVLRWPRGFPSHQTWGDQCKGGSGVSWEEEGPPQRHGALGGSSLLALLAHVGKCLLQGPSEPEMTRPWWHLPCPPSKAAVDPEQLPPVPHQPRAFEEPLQHIPGWWGKVQGGWWLPSGSGNPAPTNEPIPKGV